MKQERDLEKVLDETNELADRTHGIAKACSIFIEALMSTHPDKKTVLSFVLDAKEGLKSLNQPVFDQSTLWWLDILVTRLSEQVDKQ